MADSQTIEEAEAGAVLQADPPTPPAEVIRQQRTQQDFIVMRIAVSGLVVVILASLIGSIILAALEQSVPDGIMAAGTASVGALATMLVRPPGRDA